MKKVKWSKILKYIGNAITILAILFIIKVMLSLDIDFSIIENKPLFIFSLIFGTVIMCSTVYIIAYGWKIILSVLSNQSVSYQDSSYVYIKANMGKYLPGNVMHYVERNLFANNLGLSQKAVLLSTITEIFGLVSVCVVAGLLLEGRKIFSVLQLVMQISYIVLLVVLLSIAVIVLILFRKKIKDLFSDISFKVFLKAFLKAIPTYFLFVLFGGLVLVLIFASCIKTAITFQMVFSIIAAYTTAWVLGFVVPGSPGGIGVREIVLLFLLQSLFAEDIILTCILVHRLISILGDILAYLITVISKKRLNRLISKIN